MVRSRRLRWAGHVTRMEEDRSTFKMLTGIPAEKRPLRKGNIRVDLKQWVSIRGIRLIWLRIGIAVRAFVSAALNLRFQ
jgi:hypothetical protein